MSHAAMAAAEAAEKAVAEAAVAGTLVWEPRERGEVSQGPEVYIVTTNMGNVRSLSPYRARAAMALSKLSG